MIYSGRLGPRGLRVAHIGIGLGIALVVIWIGDGILVHATGHAGIFHARVLVRATVVTTALGLLASAIAAVTGGAFGAAAGLIGGVWERLAIRTLEALGTLPSLAMAAVACAFGSAPSLKTLLAVLVAIRISEAVRLSRVKSATLASSEFVSASRALGCSLGQILRWHVARHLAESMVQSALIGVGTLVAIESALTFLGIGLPPGVGSIGTMIASACGASEPWLAVGPLLAAVSVVTALSAVAGAVGDRAAASLSRGNLWRSEIDSLN